MRNSSDLPPNGPGGPGLRIPNFSKPSRGRIVISVAVGAVLLILFFARGLSTFFVNVLWFNALDRGDIYWAILRSKVELGVIFTLGCFVFLWVNLLIADKLAPLTLPNTPEDQTVMRIREATAKSRGKLRIALALLIGLMLGLPAASQWEDWLMFRHREPFNVSDPLFEANVGFYVFRLPFAQFVVSWAFGALVLVTIIATAFHFINGSIRPQDRIQRVTSQAKVHLSVLLAGGTLLRAADYWLSKYELTSSNRGVVRGALYTDVNAQLPALNLMILVSLAVTALLMWNIRQRGWRLPVLGLGLWVVVALVAGTIYPAVVQRFVVQPNVSTQELSFIQRNIEATKAAMGIDNVERIDTTFGGITAEDINADNAPLRDVRQLDPIQMRERFALDEGEASFYRVTDLDVDRYSVDGRMQQVLVAARELNTDGIPNRTWVSRHLIYTHGCGVIAAPASVVTNDGRPSYIDLKVTQPEMYFGDGLTGYAVVNTEQAEQPCPGSATTSYEANGGIQVNSLLRRVALAINFGEFNLFGSNLITTESEIMLVRDVRERVKKIAPFLHFDADPYPVVLNGKVKWVIDAFTTTNRYPYAETANVSQISSQSGLNHSFNYVRNSVKAVVDAYTGEAKFYLVDTKDPIAKMWQSAFPTLFTDISEVPEGLEAHFRYPEDLFRVQTNLFGRYQFDDATLFFNRDASWTVSQAPIEEPEGATPITENPGALPNPALVDSIDTSESIIRRFSPYYTIFHAPGEASGVGQFSMLRPFAPFSQDDSRKELRSLMVVSSDPQNYGKITVYDVKSQLPPGPATVAAEFESDAVIAQIITPLDLRGSRVKYGDLQVVPIGRGLIYIRPLFVLPDSADSKQIFVRKILASYDGRSVIGDNITDVVTQLFPGFNVDIGDRVGGTTTGGATTTTVPGAPVTTVPPGGSTLTPAQLLQQAERLFLEADAALAKSPPDFATYQTKLAQARALVQQALTAVR